MREDMNAHGTKLPRLRDTLVPRGDGRTWVRSRCQEQPHRAALCRVNDGCGQRIELPASSRVGEEDSRGRTQPPALPSSGGRIAPTPARARRTRPDDVQV